MALFPQLQDQPLFTAIKGIAGRAKEALLGTEERPTALRFFPSEFKKTSERLTAPLRAIAPKSREEALKSGLIPIGKRFIDPIFTGTIERVGGKIIQKAKVPIFRGFKDLTTKILNRLKGKRVTSRQEILNFTNMPELKQAERNLIREVVKEFPVTVPIRQFAQRVMRDLLPLESTNRVRHKSFVGSDDPRLRRAFNKEVGDFITQNEGTTLPPEIRGDIANYFERIYESPIKNSAGDIHYSATSYPSYFAHTRVEDLVVPGKQTVTGIPDIGKLKPDSQSIRRIIEIQSDLFQKKGLEREASFFRKLKADESLETATRKPGEKLHELEIRLTKEAEQEISQLEPYRNTWHERIIKEEIRRAAKDGKTKLQFPTGETAMKVEGLGEPDLWTIPRRTEQVTLRETLRDIDARTINQDQLKVGLEIKRFGEPDRWIVTDVLGEGKFKAVAKDAVERFKAGKMTKQALDSRAEAFDISGKIDTTNPIFRFYEKEVQKFLKRVHPEMKMITDPQGVTWFELDIKQQEAISPIEAFGTLLAPLFPFTKQDDEQSLFVPRR